MLTKLSFGFTEEDMALLKRLQAQLGGEIGKVSYVAVIRWALRKAAPVQYEGIREANAYLASANNERKG